MLVRQKPEGGFYMNKYFKTAVVASALYLSLLATTASAACLKGKACSAEKMSARNAQIVAMIKAVAPSHGVPAWFAVRIAKVESNFNPRARGSHGELGLYQLKCSTAREVGFRGNCSALLNPTINIEYGMKHLALAIRKSNGDLRMAASKHNGGLGRTRLVASYVAKVF
jgi:soluble lytic murein transglycosylase-like protein